MGIMHILTDFEDSIVIRQNLQDQFIPQWYSDVNNSSKNL